ncbi:hypothetical protein [Kitasatospora sp. NPDC058190]
MMDEPNVGADTRIASSTPMTTSLAMAEPHSMEGYSRANRA